MTVAAVELGGLRTVLIVPMIADEKAIGIIVIYRTVVRSFLGQADHIGREFREAGRHRHRERAVAQRIASAHN